MAAGQLEGEYLHRPQGSVLLVKLPPDAGPDDATPPLGPPDEPEAPTGPPDATMRLLDTIERKDAAFNALHQSYVVLYANLVEERGRAERAESRAEMLQLMLAEARAALARRRRWWPW